MKTIVGIFIAVVAFPVIAQSYGGMSEAQLQSMMSKMGEVQACYAKVDQSKLKQMADEARLMEAELKQLCADGKHVKAQVRAIALAADYSSRPEVQQLRQCAEIVQGVMPTGLMPEIPDYASLKSDENGSICDQL